MSNRFREWYQDGEWWVRHDRTTKSLARLRVDAVKALHWGWSSLFAKPMWEGSNTLHITSGLRFFDIADGYVYFEEGQITCKLRLKWAFPGLFLQDKTLSDVGAMAIEVAGTPSFDSKDVFIVHGRSDEAKTQLKNLLAGLGLQPVILNEQPHRGRTIIEQLEYHSHTCAFAFVLLTPDDVARDNETEPHLRARQNVILELGWFMARLGRENVVLMSKGKIELPSDVLGILYLEFKTDVHEKAAEISRQLRDVGLL